ncbi:MAG: hypothetical protein ACJZ9F_05735 [Rhodospirillaceae bacterium]
MNRSLIKALIFTLSLASCAYDGENYEGDYYGAYAGDLGHPFHYGVPYYGGGHAAPLVRHSPFYGHYAYDNFFYYPPGYLHGYRTGYLRRYGRYHNYYGLVRPRYSWDNRYHLRDKRERKQEKLDRRRAKQERKRIKKSLKQTNKQAKRERKKDRKANKLARKYAKSYGTYRSD